MTKTKFYAVKAGYKPGIYSWKAAFDQVNGFSSAEFKSFRTRKEVEKFISECDDEDPTRKLFKSQKIVTQHSNMFWLTNIRSGKK